MHVKLAGNLKSNKSNYARKVENVRVPTYVWQQTKDRTSCACAGAGRLSSQRLCLHALTLQSNSKLLSLFAPLFHKDNCSRKLTRDERRLEFQRDICVRV